MLKTFIAIPGLVFFLSLFSCSKTCYCTSSKLGLNYVSFTADETDSIFVTRFVPGSFFTRPRDSTWLTSQNAVFSTNQDTISIQSNLEELTIRSYYDYVLYLPALHRRDSIYGVFETRDVETGKPDIDCNCINRILSYQVNRDTLAVGDPAAPRLFIYR